MRAILGKAACLICNNEVVATGSRTPSGLYTLDGVLAAPASGASVLALPAIELTILINISPTSRRVLSPRSVNEGMMPWTQALPSESSADISAAFQHSKSRAELKCGRPIEQLRSNKGDRDTSITFLNYATEHGIFLKPARP